MPMYTPAETKIINAAWSLVTDFLENRGGFGGYDLDTLAREERASSYSSTLGHWTITECRLYVMREFCRGLANRDALIKPSDVSCHRPSLILAYMMGNDVWVRHGARSGDALDAIDSKIGAAVNAHERALARLLEKSA